MSDGIVFSEKTVDLIVEFAYKRIKNKIPAWLKLFGILKTVIRIALNILNKYADKIIPDQVDADINKGVVYLDSGKYELASECFANAENQLIDIPFLDEQHEQKAFKNATLSIIEFFKGLIEKKTNT